jgi:hypothetical protein
MGIHAIGAHEQLEVWLDPAIVGDPDEGTATAVLVTVVVATAAGALASWHAGSCEDVREILESLPRLRARDPIAVNTAVHAGALDDESERRPYEPILVRDCVVIEIDVAPTSREPLSPGSAEDPHRGQYRA